MQQHTRHVWTHLVVLCSLEQEGGAAFLLGQNLSSNFDIKVWHSLDLWCFQDNWELGNKSLNHDGVSDLQVVALERILSSRVTIPSWMTVQNVFSQSELVYSPSSKLS
jgi:hypothetical protein